MFTRSCFGLFFSIPLSTQDWHNLDVSGVKTVQLTDNVATLPTLDRIRLLGVQRIAVRLQNGSYDTPQKRAVLVGTLRAMVAHGVSHCILGVEPENAYDMKYGSPDWGIQQAHQHMLDVIAMIGALSVLPTLQVVSPGWTARGHYHDWREGLQPGVTSWVVATKAAYDLCHLNGAHFYNADTSAYDMDNRLRLQFWEEQGRRHKPLWVDELGINTGTPLERMKAYLRLATLLLETDVSLPWGGCGERVEALVPFVSSGIPQGWDAGYLLSDPACYVEVSKWIGGQSYA